MTASASSLAASFPLVPAVSTETTPFRSLVVSIDSTTTKPSIYAGETKMARPALTGDKGRYTQADPIGIRGDINLFAYAAQDPIGSNDPLGLLKRKEICRLPCNELLDGINDLSDEIERRWKTGDKLKGEGKFPKGTLKGHIQKFEEKQETLRQAIKDYEDRCGNKIPVDKWELATRPNPYPQAQITAKDIATAVMLGIIGVGVTIMTGGQVRLQPAALTIVPYSPNHSFDPDDP